MLAPGADVDFPGPVASIWSNSEHDSGSLYNANGQLVSYWPDEQIFKINRRLASAEGFSLRFAWGVMPVFARHSPSP